VERVAAAAEAARALKRDFVFTARAENFLWNRPDVDDTIRRLQAFEKAGADVLYAPGLTDIETVCSICSAVSKPVNVLVVPGFTVANLAEAGARRISLGSKLTTYSFGMLQKASREMLEEGTFDFAREGMPFAKLQGMFTKI
ncbi:MAG: isocitrate lyase/phosphoenolpyruvate mutase family protein, partial [Mesorhizobium sp.]